MASTIVGMPTRLSPTTPAANESAPPKEYTIDELARAADTTVRNVRAYQDRGILPPPEIRGRTGIYNEGHRSRLKTISQLLSRGYTVANIGELFQALEQGQGLAHLIGLESAVTSPWTDEVPASYSLPDIARMFGGHFNPKWLARALELGILQRDGMGFRARSPRQLQAGAELVKVGIPLDEMLEVVAQLRGNVERAAEDMVRLVEQYVFDRYGKGLPPAEEMPKLANVVWRLRPLVEMAVHAEVARAMEIAAHKHLGDRLAHVMQQLQSPPPKE